MDTADYERLKLLLESLPSEVSETARVCWDEYNWGDWDDRPLGGVKYAAWAYSSTFEQNLKIGLKDTNTTKPHEIERTLRRLVASARDLCSKIKFIQSRPEYLDVIQNSSQLCHPFLLNDTTTTKKGRNQVDLRKWFLFHCVPNDSDEPMKEPTAYSTQIGIQLDELESMAQAIELIADKIGADKQPPNGPRMGMDTRLTPLEWLLFLIGRIVSFRNRDLSHVLPIARKIHEWLTGEGVGKTWGQRPFDRVEPMLNALKWNESDKERIYPVDQ